MQPVNKKYAVFIPCYNAAATITETLNSVKEAIAFTGLTIPVYVYDDCSKDQSVSIVQEAQQNWETLKLVRNTKNSGERHTTNSAFRFFNERYNWVFIIHADDIVKKDWLTTLIANCETANDDTCFTVWSSYDTLFDVSKKVIPGDDSGQVHAVSKGPDKVRYYLTKISSNWHLSGCVLNPKLYNKLQGFDEGMPQYGDTDFYVRGLMSGYTDIYVCRTLTFYRMAEGTVTSTSFKTNRDIREIYMLINKFGHLLSRKEMLTMYRSIQKMSGKRMIKWLMRKELKLALMNFRQFWQSSGHAISLFWGYRPGITKPGKTTD